MKKQIYLFFLFFFFGMHLTNAQLKVYPALEPLLVKNDTSSLPPSEVDAENAYPLIGKNTLFKVKVKQLSDTNWQDLFVNNTFVTNSDNWQDVSKGRINSSYVTFEFKGEILLEITSPQLINNVIIRPISKNITKTISGNKLTIKLTQPEKLSVEINGNRYKNLHIFANEFESAPDFENLYPDKTIVDYKTPGHVIYDTTKNSIHNKVIIVRAGTILKVPYKKGLAAERSNGKIILNDNDIFYIEGGAYLKGGLRVEDVKNVKILGKGVIDLTDFPKTYQMSDLDSDYAYVQGATIWKSENIEVNGPIFNDSQQVGIQIDGSTNVSIIDSKIFTRVNWGDGIQIKGSNRINIKNSFIRTNDDAISIYASRRTDWEEIYQNKDTYDINVENTSLYADGAHPIQIGWHGSQESNNRKFIHNLTFNNIDILEHKALHSTYPEYAGGVITINCGDENTCSNYLFNNINIENFSKGRLFNLIVEKADSTGFALADGKHIEKIRFENINYNGNTTIPSQINGLRCERFVDGVFFENFRVNGNVITKKEDYIFDTNQYAYNITFQEGNNYSSVLQDDIYYIKNETSGKYISYNSNTSKVELSNTKNDNTKWIINRIGVGEYRIEHLMSGKILENSLEGIYSINDINSCQGRYLLGEDLNTIKTSQQWKINPSGSSFLINNAYTRAHFTQINNDVVAYPKKENSINQKWKIIPVSSVINPCIGNQGLIEPCLEPSQQKNTIYPNPTSDLLTIDLNQGVISQNEYTTEIVDINGKVILSNKFKNKTSLKLGSKLSKGYYVVNIYDSNGNKIISKKIIKN